MPHRTFTAGDADYIARMNALASSADRRLAQNLLINSGMQVWQRGTSIAGVASPASKAYGPDRWTLYRASSATGMTVSRQAGDTTAGSRYCARVQRDSGNSSTAIVYLRQPMSTENSIALRGKRLGVRFKARRGSNYSASSNVLVVSVVTGTGTDEHPSGPYTGGASQAAVNVTLTTSFQVFNVDLGTVGTTVTELAPGFYYTPVGTAGAADYFEVTDVLLSVTTDSNVDLGDYPYRSFEDELARCLPYYEKSFAYATTPAQNAGGVGASWWPQILGASTSQHLPGMVLYKVAKRSGSPTVTLYNPSAANAQIRNTTDGTDWSSSTVAQSNANGFILSGTSPSGSAAGEVASVQWTSDAELV